MDSQPVSKRTMIFALILVLIATIIWGSQYLIIKNATEIIPVFLFQGVRHLIAFLGFLPFMGRLKLLNKPTITASLISSIVFYFLLLFLNFGLQLTTSSKGAFLACLYVVATPFLSYIILKSKIERKHYIAVLIAVIGMGILVFGNGNVTDTELAFNVGDILVFVAAMINGLQIVLVEKYVKTIDIFLFCMLQMFFIAVMMLFSSWIVGEQLVLGNLSGSLWFAWIYIGIFATCITLIIQSYAQKFIDSTRAALLYALEPVFAMFFGVIIGHETITVAIFLGSALILTAIFVASVNLKKN